ncbi:ABC transporter ATP-binding protein [Alkalihalobacillus clausii]|nr:ABC transporter ATP-binding protein [Shouchella clausii]MBU3262685.1 ABC transporter ATP-binding protein [Shouchella clausii]MBU3506999.1 ABC transporter ATP-binding protein [Shouchella clausii]MBU3533140.1 ABC transporter ATP-binding protein [Shouchella clausii]
MRKMIKIEDLDLVTREKLLYNGNAELKRGFIYGLSARNGSGKTTLLRTIAGIRSETKGSIYYISNHEIYSLPELKRKLFYYESSEWFDPNLTGFDYLTFIQREWSNKNACIDDVVDYWEMNQYIKIPIKKYSLGMKQRVLLGLYEVSGAEYWLMDEPTIGLDTNSIEKFEKLLAREKGKNKAILFSSHQDDRIYKVCDYIYELGNGSLVMREASQKGENR